MSPALTLTLEEVAAIHDAIADRIERRHTRLGAHERTVLDAALQKVGDLLDARVPEPPAAPVPVRARFTRTADGSLTTTIDGVTYTATWYRSGGPGTRAYWTNRHDGPFAPDYNDGNDWYEPNERRVREAIVAYAAKAKTSGGAR